MTGDHRTRVLVHVVEGVPAQNPVDAGVGLREALLEKRREIGDTALSCVAIDVTKQVLDEDLASELLAEEGNVRPYDRTQIEQDRLSVRLQAGEELRERFRGVHGRG